MTSPDDPIREEAAMLFANGETQPAIDFLINYLNQNAKQSGAELWLLLMEIYQASGDRESFERLASIYAQRFQRSPPSWAQRHRPASTRMGRNVLVLDGNPTQINPSRWRDFLASAREAKFCRLDLSRVRLPDGPSGFEPEAEAILQLMDRLNRQHTRILLMGDGGLRERLARDIEQWPIEPARRAAMRLLLGLLQWRGQDKPFEALAMRFADDYGTSPPGYEARFVLAKDDPEPEQGEGERVLDEADVDAWAEALLVTYRKVGHVEVDLRQFDRVTYPAAVRLARWFADHGLNRHHLVFRGVNLLFRALFDPVGISEQVTYEQRVATI